MLILTYVVAFVVSLVVLWLGKWYVLRPIVQNIIRHKKSFAGKNTLLITEFLYKFCIQIAVMLSGVAVFYLFGQAPAVWLLAVFAIAPIFDNWTAYQKNVRERSPRPSVYLASGLSGDGLGLLCGYVLFAVILYKYLVV